MISIRSAALVFLLAASALAGPSRNTLGPAERGSPSDRLNIAPPRPPMQTDFDRCVLRIQDTGNEHIQGRLRLQLLVRASGEVFAAYVHSEKGVDDRRLERCLAATALSWKLPP